MTRVADVIAIVALSVLFSAVAIWAYRSGGRPRLWAIWAAAATILAVLGYLDWKSISYPEGPVTGEILAGVVPTLAATCIVQWAGARGERFWLQLLAASSVCLILIPGTLFVSLFLMGPYFP